MKRLLILLILLFALPAYAEQCSEENPCPELARLNIMGGSVPVAGGVAGCSAAKGSTLESAGEASISGYLVAYQFTMAETCKVNKIYGRCSGANVKMGLYADNGSNKPGNLLQQGTSAADAPVACGWVSVSITEETLTNTVKYWVAIVGDTSSMCGAVQSNVEYVLQTYANAFPSPFGGSTSYTFEPGLYAIWE